MGRMSNDDAVSALEGISKYFKNLLPRLLQLNDYMVRLAIMTIAQYLYGMYYRFGTKKGSSYIIKAETMNVVYAGTKYANIAGLIITARNGICHSVNSDDTNNTIKMLIENPLLIDFLKFEGLLDNDSNYVEPENGYTSVDNIDDWVHPSVIKTVKEVDNKFGTAISKMIGE